jgi:Na+-translocating ferredoxin:NAD+ oxidoreductase RnfD subunit
MVRLLVLVGALSASAFGQAVYGTIGGTVLDPSGAGVVGARVAITDQQRNIEQITTTNGAGNYSLGHLIIGKYRVQVEMTGFKTAVQENVEVAVDTLRTLDITLQTGDVKETVTVTDEAPLLKTERTDVATTLTEKQVTELPTFQRNFSQLIATYPSNAWCDSIQLERYLHGKSARRYCGQRERPDVRGRGRHSRRHRQPGHDVRQHADRP